MARKMKSKFRDTLPEEPEERDIDSQLAAKWKFRVDLVTHERYGPRAFMDFVEENEPRIRVMFDESEKAELRRGIEQTLGMKLSVDDITYISSIFGSTTPVKPPVRSAVVRDVKPISPEQGIAYMRTCTFECFCEWMDCSEDFVKGLTNDQFFQLLDCISDICLKDAGLPRQRHVEDGDAEKLISLAKHWYGCAC